MYLDGRPHQETGEVLGMTPTHVATRIGRLKERLRAAFRAAGHLDTVLDTGADLQRQWATQSQRIDELIRINRQLLLQQALQPVRASLRRSRIWDMFEMLLAALCLLGTATFIRVHYTEPRFWVPGVALHLWFMAAAAVSVARFVRKGAILYDAPVLALQRQLESVRSLTLRAVRVLFVTGLIVWGAPAWIVVARAVGWDVYAWPGITVLLEVLAASAVLAALAQGICAWCAARLERMPRLRQLARDLAGYNLKVAEERLVQLTRLEAEP